MAELIDFTSRLRTKLTAPEADLFEYSLICGGCDNDAMNVRLDGTILCPICDKTVTTTGFDAEFLEGLAESFRTCDE